MSLDEMQGVYVIGCSYGLFFFFSSRRRHTIYWRDCSSDVCSSDLSAKRRAPRSTGAGGGQGAGNGGASRLRRHRGDEGRDDLPLPPPYPAPARRARRLQRVAVLRRILRTGERRVVPAAVPGSAVESGAGKPNRGGGPGGIVFTTCPPK